MSVGRICTRHFDMATASELAQDEANCSGDDRTGLRILLKALEAPAVELGDPSLLAVRSLNSR